MWYTFGHREAESFGLSLFVIGILADDDNFRLVKGAQVKCIENLSPRRVAHARTIFIAHEVGQILELGRFQFRLQSRRPGRVYFYIHNFS